MEADLSELERRAKEAAAKVTAAKAEHWARGVMRNVAYDAGAGPEMASESTMDQGLSPEDARQAQDAAKRWATEQLAAGALRRGLGGTAHGQAQGIAQMLRAPGKVFSRETILAILKGHLALATARPPEMTERDAIRALITVFENLE